MSIATLSEQAMWGTGLVNRLKTELEDDFIPNIPPRDGSMISLDGAVRCSFPTNHFGRQFLAVQLDRWRIDSTADRSVYDVIVEAYFRLYYENLPSEDAETLNIRHVMNALTNWLLSPTGKDSRRAVRTDEGALWHIDAIPATLFDRVFPRSGSFGAVLVAEFRTTMNFRA